MGRMSPRFWLLAALVFLPEWAAAQSTATIQGQVTDAESGNPLPGANVVLY